MPVVLTGFDELIQLLTDAPEALRRDGFQIVQEETEAAAVEIDQSYSAHSKTGNLAKRVTTMYPAEAVLIGIVRSASPHAHLYEWGTGARTTAAGANRGAMPAHKTTPQIAQRHRDRMEVRLREMLERHGYDVTE